MCSIHVYDIPLASSCSLDGHDVLSMACLTCLQEFFPSFHTVVNQQHEQTCNYHHQSDPSHFQGNEVDEAVVGAVCNCPEQILSTVVKGGCINSSHILHEKNSTLAMTSA